MKQSNSQLKFSESQLRDSNRSLTHRKEDSSTEPRTAAVYKNVMLMKQLSEKSAKS